MAKIYVKSMKLSDKKIKTAANAGLKEAMREMYEHNTDQELMPYWTGATQNTAKFIGPRKQAARIQHTTPYSKAIYYGGPRSQRLNRNAGPLWWEEYLSGGMYADIPLEAFEKGMKKKL